MISTSIGKSHGNRCNNIYKCSDLSLSERWIHAYMLQRSWALPQACGVASSGPAEEEITAPCGIRRPSSHDGRVVAIGVRH